MAQEFVYVDFSFKLKALTLRTEPQEGSSYHVQWKRGSRWSGQTDWQTAVPRADKHGASVWQVRWGKGAGHEERLTNVHIPVKSAPGASPAQRRFLELKLFRRDASTEEIGQVGRTVKWKLEYNNAEPGKRRSGMLDFSEKGCEKEMQISTSYSMNEVPPEVAAEAQQDRRALRKARGLNPDVASGVATSAAETDAEARPLLRPPQQPQQRVRTESVEEQPVEPLSASQRRSSLQRSSQSQPLPPAAFPPAPVHLPPPHDSHTAPESALAPERTPPQEYFSPSPCAGFYQQQQQQLELAHQRQMYQDPYEENNYQQRDALDVDKMKYQVLKLYSKLTEQGGQLEEKRRDLRQMHRLYVELKRDYENAQEELEKRDLHIGELSEMLATEREGIFKKLQAENDTLQRRTRGVDMHKYDTAQKRNCDCVVL